MNEMMVTDKAEFKERVCAWAEKLGVRVTSISVRPMSNKWASYSTSGRLTFDASLLELPEELRDYVITHELLHFHVPNHGKLWKSLMRAHLGDYERLEDHLNRVVQSKAQSLTASTNADCHALRRTVAEPDAGRAL